MDEYEQWYPWEHVPLQIFINHARGADPDDWPPQEEWENSPDLNPWWHCFNEIKNAIDRKDLLGNPKGQIAWKKSTVRPSDLMNHAARRNGDATAPATSAMPRSPGTCLSTPCRSMSASTRNTKTSSNPNRAAPDADSAIASPP